MPHVAGIHEERADSGTCDRVTHCFPLRQYVATNLIRILRECNTFSSELQVIVHGNGADAAVRLQHMA